MWNDTDIPLAYLITFRCYGTWLHGDERGSVDRYHNTYEEPFVPANEKWKSHNRLAFKGKAVKLDAKARAIVERAIRETCEIRNWRLAAINIRTNHVHLVVSASDKPGKMLNALKANATRMLRERKCWMEYHSPWVASGSKKFLWNERSIEQAIDYVVNGQGNKLPKFDQ